MKKRFVLITIVMSLICTWVQAHFQQNTVETVQKELSEEVLRFHVRANSNREEDQKIKMEIKQAVVGYLQPFLAQAANMEEARILVENHFPKMKSMIHEILNQEGYSYGFHVEIKKEHFPRKTYGDCTFPEGIYEAVIISLGSGQGNNWWCMIYPGLCFLDETYGIVTEEKKKELEGVLTEGTYEWVTDPEHIRIKFRIDWLNHLFGIEE